MNPTFFWIVLFVFAMTLLLEAASILNRSSWNHRLTLGTLFVLVIGVMGLTGRIFIMQQAPSLSFALPSFFLSIPS